MRKSSLFNTVYKKENRRFAVASDSRYRESYSPSGSINAEHFFIVLATLCTTLASYHFSTSKQNADSHDNATKSYAHIRSIRLPRPPLREFDITQWRQNVRESASTGGADQFKHDTEIAGEKTESHGGDDQGGGENEMAVRIEGFMGKVVEIHDLSADEGFKGQCCEHV